MRKYKRNPAFLARCRMFDCYILQRAFFALRNRITHVLFHVYIDKLSQIFYNKYQEMNICSIYFRIRAYIRWEP